MKKINGYLINLAKHSENKNESYLNVPRNKILVHAGIGLNWLGDYFANSKIIWQEKILPIKKIQFSGTSPQWNKILIDRCHRSVKKFRLLIQKNPNIKSKFAKEASFGSETILVRKSNDPGYYRVLDGMHRFIGIALGRKNTIKVYVPINEEKYLPICEAHTVYDLIRGFKRHANDSAGKKELYYALKLLSRTYANVKTLLKNRFNLDYVHNKHVQEVIKKILDINK